ncbi:MAG TPA: amino acid adenylation domain-containing protein [Longimicrobium sp.]|nr:amino acid adenylation domain-containing protein [Longimicrobium sp.]
MPQHQTTAPALPELSPPEHAYLQRFLTPDAAAAAIPRRAPDAEAPLSFAQERLWFLDRLRPGDTAYVLTEALRLAGGVDEVALARALGEIVRRHEALRTTIRETEGVPVQVVAPFAGFELPTDDLTALAPPEREAGLAGAAAAEAARGFDLTAGPLFRARLLRLAADDHVLLLCMHHIVADGGSLQVLAHELWALYAAYHEGGESPLPPLALQYGDFAAWQRAEAGSEAEARQLAYWKARLAGAPEVVSLPTDFPRPPVTTFRGGGVPVEVPAETVDRLRALARAEGTTPMAVVLAAFQVLLGRYAGSEDVVVGTPVPGRARAEADALIGPFVNTLVVRTDLSGDPAFRAVAAQVRDGVRAAAEHGDVPFERLVAELRPERSLSHTSLFQVLFQMDEAQPAAPAAPGIGVRRMEMMAPAAARFDLALVLQPHGRGLRGVLQYSTDLFERSTARRMAEHLERMLDQAALHPDARVSRLRLMRRAERQRVLEWNRTSGRYPADRCIHQLFGAQAARTPDAAALLYEGGSLSFRALDARANRVAHHLRRLGVGPEARVGICLERGPELLACILGTLKAGGAYVPLDAAYPAERIAYMLADSGARVLLTETRLRDTLAVPDGVRVVCVDAEAEAIAAQPDEAPESGVTSENLAYVIYTSGSTGRPKGVAMHHRGVSNYIHWGIRAYGADQGNGAPVFSSMAVDLTITNLLPLFAGRPVHLLPEANAVEALAQALRAGPGFGLIKITPIHLGLLNALLSPEELRGAARTLVIGADFLVAEPTLPWQEHAPGVRLMNEYGPTETVVGCSAYVLPPGRHRAGPVPVGHPIQNLRFYVLDVHGEPVPIGLPGELYIGGAGVARGYLGRPALSAEKFVPDPFAEPGARMYRSGDRARWLADGNLVILGRTDNQVKIRGFRVELGEVEAALRRRPEVRECLATLREDRPGDRRMVAYVVPGPAGADARILREHLLRDLPEYMVPDAFVLLDRLPQTSTGKLDRRTLPVPAYGRGEAVPDEPRDALEVELIGMWEALLGVEGIGPGQSFFELGGNSLLALRLFAQVNRRMQCELPLATLFAGATVRRMAEAIRECTAPADAAS